MIMFTKAMLTSLMFEEIKTVSDQNEIFIMLQHYYQVVFEEEVLFTMSIVVYV